MTEYLRKMDRNISPPEAARELHRIFRKYTGLNDLYADVKREFNAYILSIIKEIEITAKSSQNPFSTFILLAIAGNVIDFGHNSNLKKEDVSCVINSCFNQKLYPLAVEKMRKAVQGVRRILYLGDNAGEIVFDKIFIRHLPAEKIIYAVRGRPILNDATMEDARQVGMEDVVRVIDNGSDTPGTILNDCSKEFVRTFNEADLIISKGQGNYETLNETDKPIFFLLKVKCETIAQEIGEPVGSYILKSLNI